MTDNEDRPDLGRRAALECMAWAGTGLLWTVVGGVPASRLIGRAQAAEETGLTFVHMSDSHVGFSKPANPDVVGTLKEAVDQIGALQQKPSFIIHTGDITHLSKPQEFDDAEKVIGSTKLDAYFVPGEHDIIDEANGKAYMERFGKKARGAGWYSFDQGGV